MSYQPNAPDPRERVGNYSGPDDPTMAYPQQPPYQQQYQQQPPQQQQYQQPYRQQENYGGPPARQQVESRAVSAEDRNLERANLRYWFTTIIYFLLGVMEVIMLLRFIFRLLGANPGSPFVSFLYQLSHVFVVPFNGIFNDQALGTRSVFEVSTLIAMLLYALIAWGLVSLVRVILAPSITRGGSRYN